MAKKGELTREDLMILEMGGGALRKFYIVERAPYEERGEKRAVHRFGTSADAVFSDRDRAVEELEKFPSKEADESAE